MRGTSLWGTMLDNIASAERDREERIEIEEMVCLIITAARPADLG